MVELGKSEKKTSFWSKIRNSQPWFHNLIPFNYTNLRQGHLSISKIQAIKMRHFLGHSEVLLKNGFLWRFFFRRQKNNSSEIFGNLGKNGHFSPKINLFRFFISTTPLDSKVLASTRGWLDHTYSWVATIRL